MIKILYVDDETDLLEVGKLFLEKPNEIQVEVAPSAEEALDKLQEGGYDAIISDYQMPVMNGIAFLKRLRAEDNDIPFILFTGRGREEMVIEALNSGVDFYVQKGGDPTAQFRELEHKAREAVRRHRAEEALNHSQQMLQLVLDSVPQNVIWKDRDLRYIGCNKNAAMAVGLPEPRDLIGKSDYGIVHPDSADRYRADDRQVMDSGVPKINFEEKLIQLDGSVRWLRTSKVPLQDSDGRTIGVMGSYEDITERKLAEEELKASRLRQTMAMDLANLVEWEMDLSTGRFIFNDRFYELYGTDAGQEGGYLLPPEAYVRRFVHPDDVDEVEKAITRARSPDLIDDHFQMEHRILRKDGGVRQ